MRKILMLINFWCAKRRAKKYFAKIRGTENVYVVLIGKRFVVLTKRHFRLLMRKNFINRSITWEFTKQNALYVVQKSL